MKLLTLFAALIPAALSLYAKNPTGVPVKICLRADIGMPWSITQSEAGAAEMFAKIGVRLEWYHDGRHCGRPPQDFLMVHLATRTPDKEFPGALAFSRPAQGSDIEVFYDRVIAAVEPTRAPKLLAHVFAHEIGHVLEGVSRHSLDGVMKAHFDEHDFQQMAYQPLPFAPEDIEFIQRGVSQRTLALLQPKIGR